LICVNGMISEVGFATF